MEDVSVLDRFIVKHRHVCSQDTYANRIKGNGTESLLTSRGASSKISLK